MSEPFGSLSLEHSSTVDRVADELRRAVFDGELESGTAAARGRPGRVARRLPADRSARRSASWSPRAWPPGSPTAGSRSPRPDPDSIRDVCQARAVLEVAGVRHWPTRDARGAATAVRDGAGRLHGGGRTTGRRTRCSTSGTSTSTSSLVGPDRVAAAGGDGRPACTPSSGWRWPRSTGPARTHPTRPARTPCWCGCSRAATSTRPSTELEDAPRGRRGRDPRPAAPRRARAGLIRPATSRIAS